MLVQITRKCMEECTHCMQDCGPNVEEHMTIDTARNVAKFFRKVKPKHIIITGGEFTCHPNFKDLITFLLNNINYTCTVMLQSNGHFATNQEKLYDVKTLFGTFHHSPHHDSPMVQHLMVTSDSRYYPNYREFVHTAMPILNREFRTTVNICVNTVELILPLGRGKNIKKSKEYHYAPSCINAHLAALQSKSLEDTIKHLEGANKLCKPSILPDGKIVAGECYSCTEIGDVNTGNPEQVYHALRLIKPCDKCGLFARKYREIYSGVERNKVWP